MSKTFATQRRFLSEILFTADGLKTQGDERNTAAAKKSLHKDKFRKLVIQSNVMRSVAGSAFVELGNTRVSCSINGPKEQQSGESALEGILDVSLSGCVDSALRYSIKHALQTVVCLKKLARTELSVQLNVLSDDGGALAACLLAAGVAIASANIEMFDILLACQVLVLPSAEESPSSPVILLDPDLSTIQTHQNRAATLTLAVIPSIHQIVCVEFGGSPLPLQILRQAMPRAFAQCLSLEPIVREALLKNIADSAF